MTSIIIVALAVVTTQPEVVVTVHEPRPPTAASTNLKIQCGKTFIELRNVGAARPRATTHPQLRVDGRPFANLAKSLAFLGEWSAAYRFSLKCPQEGGFDIVAYRAAPVAGKVRYEAIAIRGHVQGSVTISTPEETDEAGFWF